MNLSTNGKKNSFCLLFNLVFLYVKFYFILNERFLMIKFRNCKTISYWNIKVLKKYIKCVLNEACHNDKSG